METIKYFKEFIGFEYQTIPVMRNGKPTKKTKEVRVEMNSDVEYELTEIEGHQVYVEKEPRFDTLSIRTLDGEYLTFNYRKGYSGQNTYTARLFLDAKTRKFYYKAGQGYDGPMGKGSQVIVLNINWK